MTRAQRTSATCLLLLLAACGEQPGVAGADHHTAVEDPQSLTTTTIGEDMAERFGIVSSAAGPAQITENLRVFGHVRAVPDAEVTLRARFPGRVEAVHVAVGDKVAGGTPLVTIESNDSLESYEIESPLAGVVVDRWINEGEETGDEPIFRIVDLTEVWVELALFPSQRSQAAVGQRVAARSVNDNVLLGVGEISWIALEAEPDQSVRARVVLANPDRLLLPGMMIGAELTVGTHAVPLAVEQAALQTSGPDTVVYVQRGERYEARAVRLGRQDDSFAEILAGLEAGERYVTDNSYLVKADIEKAGAADEP